MLLESKIPKRQEKHYEARMLVRFNTSIAGKDSRVSSCYTIIQYVIFV